MSFAYNKVEPNSKKMDFTGAENQCSRFPEIYLNHQDWNAQWTK